MKVSTMTDTDCPFCNPDKGEIFMANDLCYARYDAFPVNPGHLLVIPFRHVASFFDTTEEERHALLGLIDTCRASLDEEFHPAGYNIGVNVGKVAGQSVMHMHVHFIPRYRGDTEHPGGGVRGVIPERREYYCP
jgi:diadenosine tetraphosphate (Ap4A) HIT family hydrolase